MCKQTEQQKIQNILPIHAVWSGSAIFANKSLGITGKRSTADVQSDQGLFLLTYIY